MSFLKKFSNTVMDTASSIGAKSADLMETGKSKLQRNQLESDIDEKKALIGDLVYRAHRQGDSPSTDGLAQLFAEITDIENQIAALDEKLHKETPQAASPGAAREDTPEKPSGDLIFCSKCGQHLAVGTKFCNKCGQPQ